MLFAVAKFNNYMFDIKLLFENSMELVGGGWYAQFVTLWEGVNTPYSVPDQKGLKPSVLDVRAHWDKQIHPHNHIVTGPQLFDKHNSELLPRWSSLGRNALRLYWLITNNRFWECNG